MQHFRLRGPLLGAIAAVLSAFLCEAGWEAKWRRTKLTPAQATAAAKVLEDLIDSEIVANKRSKSLHSIFQGEDQDVSNDNIYKDVDWKSAGKARRYRPLCKMFFMKVSMSAATQRYDKPTLTSPCSCAFIGQKQVLLAAHCLREKDPKLDILPENWDVGFVVPQYGLAGLDAKAHQDHMRAHARLITEWWYPEGFPATGGDIFWDVGFLKISKPIDDLKEFYTMALPWDVPGMRNAQDVLDWKKKTKSSEYYTIDAMKLVALGYPTDYKGGEVAINFKGECGFGKSKGRLTLDLSGKVERKGNSVKKKPVLKASGAGSSGGPWILNDKELAVLRKANARANLEMAVISLSKRACSLKDKCNTIDGPVFTPRLIEAAEKIGKIEEPTAAQVVKVSETVQVVTLQLTTTDEANKPYEFL